MENYRVRLIAMPDIVYATFAERKKKLRTGAKLRNWRMTMLGRQCGTLETTVCLITSNIMGWQGVVASEFGFFTAAFYKYELQLDLCLLTLLKLSVFRFH